MTAAMSLLLLPFCVYLVVSVGAQTQECSHDTMRRCRRDGLESINTNRNNADEQCRMIRENFNCLMWQTSSCLDKEEQDNNRDPIYRIWRYLQSFCESHGSWYTKACYQRENVRRCEKLLPTRGQTIDSSSCRSFASFKECVMSVVQLDCSNTDQDLLQTYFMEKGQQRSWNCPRDSGRTFPASLVSEDGDTLGGDPTYAYCSDGSRVSLTECRSDFYSAQKDARDRNDSDLRHHYTCCALVHYEECVADALRYSCGEDGRSRSEARSIVSEMKQRYSYYSCDDHTTTECNAAASLVSYASLITVLLMILAIKRL